MPMSEDEFDSNKHVPQINTMSKAELRKSHKPIMEKRRRARINQCLNEIKNLILEAMNKDPARHTKLEKADILEMAVKHLQNVQRQQLALAMATDPSVMRKFKGGFNECASEIDRFIQKSDNLENGVRDRVSNHLQKCINGLEQVVQFSNPNPSFVSVSTIFPGNQSLDNPGGSGDQNNNPRIQIPQGLQLIPSRLPTGELALLVPNSSNLPYFPTSSNRPSAFVTVTPQTMDSSKPLSPPMSPVEQPSASPKGFRPVQAHLPRPKPSYPGEDHQVPQISSTVGGGGEKHQFTGPLEVKTMKFPILKTLEKEKKVVEHTSVIKKVSEPLCVITNQAERYRQAQQKEESVFLEENQVPNRGIKRDFSEMHANSHQGILTTVPQESLSRPSKIIKTTHHMVPSTSYVRSLSEAQGSLSFHAKEEQQSSCCSSGSSKHRHESLFLGEECRQLESFVPLERSSRQPQNNYDGRQENDQKNESNDMWRPW